MGNYVDYNSWNSGRILTLLFYIGLFWKDSAVYVKILGHSEAIEACAITK